MIELEILLWIDAIMMIFTIAGVVLTKHVSFIGGTIILFLNLLLISYVLYGYH